MPTPSPRYGRPTHRIRPWQAALIGILLAVQPARAAQPLRSFTLPPAQPEAPAPSRAPRITVKPQTAAPLALTLAWNGRNLPFAYACTAAQAALVEPASTAPPDPPCQGAFLVTPELP
jgi:hypothetical protein